MLPRIRPGRGRLEGGEPPPRTDQVPEDPPGEGRLLPHLSHCVRKGAVPVGEVHADRQALLLGDSDRIAERQAEQEFQFARGARGTETPEYCPRESGIVRGHRGETSPPGDSIDDGEETGPKIPPRIVDVGPLPLHDPDAEAQAEGAIGVFEASLPPARDRARDAGGFGREQAKQVESRVGGLRSQRIETEGHVSIARLIEEGLDEDGREMERRCFQGNDRIEGLVPDGIDRVHVAAGRLGRFRAVAVPETDRAANPPLV